MNQCQEDPKFNPEVLISEVDRYEAVEISVD